MTIRDTATGRLYEGFVTLVDIEEPEEMSTLVVRLADILAENRFVPVDSNTTLADSRHPHARLF